MGKRRGHGEGSIYKRRDGYWVGQAEGGRCPGGHEKRDGTICRGGERRRVRVVRRTKAAVLKELDELKRRGAAGITGGDQTVEEYIRWWLDTVRIRDVRAGVLSEGSHATYHRWLKDRLVPHIGHIKLRKLEPVDIERMMAALEANGIAPKTRNAARSLLSSALKHAVGLKLIPTNPADHVRGSKLGAKLDDALDDDELERCLAVARPDRLFGLLYISSTLGLRQGEALSLRWDDIDLDADTLRVERSKTRSGLRTLPLVAGCDEVLRDHRRRQAAERLEAGPLWHHSGLVFVRPDGRPILARELLRWWYTTQAAAGVSRRRWHALRHSAVQRLLNAGTPIEIVSAVAGHGNLAITHDVYGRPGQDRLRRALRDYDQGSNEATS